MKPLVFVAFAGIFLFPFSLSSKDYKLSSPDGRTQITVNTDSNLSWQVSRDAQTVILPSEMSMTLEDGSILGTSPKVKSAKQITVNSEFQTPFYKKSSVKDYYNLLTLKFAGDYSVEFRAYDSGVAYRFVTSKSSDVTIVNESANFRFDSDYKAFVPYVNDNRGGERYCYSFESYYTEGSMSSMVNDSLSIVPLLVDLGNHKKVAVMEAGAEDYPGMFLKVNPAERTSLISEFAPYPLEYSRKGSNMVPVKRADYIAKTSGTRTYPWRVLVISDNDTELADNDLAQCLAPACRVSDVSWIKPGKVSWEWWNNKNITGVDFKVGTNNETYNYYIDFAAANHIEYIVVDGGWSTMSLKNSRPGLDIKALVDYGNKRGVGVILWALAATAEIEAPEVFPYYSQMGVKGFKVDFFDADDQKSVQQMYDLAKLAAENHLLLDLHGMKAFGIQRAYPNVVNFEGVKGLENTKWTAIVNEVPVDNIPRYDVTIPYTRMLVGPMDYTPGAMDNANIRKYRSINDNPMSMGTRVHQMAMYTVFEAPLEMLADSPTKYMREQECTDFISKVPTVFDRTVAVAGEVGEYVVIARQKDGVWYVGAMTDWTERDIEIDFSFLGTGKFKADIFSDGINADASPQDYAHTASSVDAGTKIKVHLAPGGGWTARLTPWA